MPSSRPGYLPLPVVRGYHPLPTVENEPVHFRHRRPLKLPAILFGLTCLCTFWAQASGGDPTLPFYGPVAVAEKIAARWQDGLVYMVAIISILLSHEMGHFVAALYHRIPTSLPMFIPMPVPPVGTMGAVIAMHGSHADRRQLFDIGVAGPLAGLVVAVPVVALGVMYAPLDFDRQRIVFDQPLIVEWLAAWLRPGVDPESLKLETWLLAGWVGMLVTGLNMMPLSQLDGGHIVYALLGRRWAHRAAEAFLFAAVAFVAATDRWMWSLMLVLVLLMGIYHPPTAKEHLHPLVRHDHLGPVRTAIGWLSLLIPVVCFPPFAIDI